MGEILMIEQGDLLLVPFPFSDQSGRKVRPVIVVSNNEFNKHSEDVIVVRVTTNFSKDRHTLNFNNSDLKNGKLVTNCFIKVENILRIDSGLIIKKIGEVKKEKLTDISNLVVEIIKV